MGNGCTKFVATMTCKNSNCCSGNNIQVIETDVKLAHERLDKLDEILQITKALEQEYLHKHRKSYKSCIELIESEVKTIDVEV